MLMLSIHSSLLLWKRINSLGFIAFQAPENALKRPSLSSSTSIINFRPSAKNIFHSFLRWYEKSFSFSFNMIAKKNFFLPPLNCSSRIGKHLVEQLKMNHLSKHIWKLRCEANLNFLLHHHHQHQRNFSRRC